MSTEPMVSQPDGTTTKEFMRRLPLFADLPEEDLERLYAMARPLRVVAGQRVIEEGQPGDALYIVVEGELEISKREGEREVVLATRGAGEFIGELSLLVQAPRSASVRALRDTQLLVISQAAFQGLLACSPSAPRNLLRTVTARLRSTASMLMQQEKLAALGTLAAGLAHELNQVWTNLIDNALDAMQGHGELRLRTCARGDEVVVEIGDTGPGIPPEIQPRIFEPFFTTKPPGQGTGLGLHLSHNIVVHRHHGQIQLTSRPGETCFRVTLPVRLRS